MNKIAVAIFTSMIILLQTAVADDIGWVTLTSKADAEFISTIADKPFTRFGNRFLVSLSPRQVHDIQQAGITFELLLPNTEPSQWYLVQPLCGYEHSPSALNKYGGVTSLGNGMYIMSLQEQALATLADSTHYVAVPLTQRQVRWYYQPPTVSNRLRAVSDFPTDSLANLVNMDSVYAWDTRLEAFQTRYVTTDSLVAARDWIMQKFLDWGYTDVSLQPFSYNGLNLYNVVCVKLGTVKPDKVIVVGAHYDSYNQSSDPRIFAPGADDNGSGTTTTMEIARVLAGVPLRKTVIFIPFSAEEVGLVGSNHAAITFVQDSTDIEVMYNFDMVGYDPYTAREISIGHGGIVQAYAEVTGDAAQRVTTLTPVTSISPGGSDHMSFAAQGYPVVNSIEAEFNYPGWHTNIDISSRLDFTYLSEVVKMGVASVAYVANAAEPTIVERVVDQGDGQSLEVFWSDCDPTYTYRVRWGLESGIYTDSADVPSGACSFVIGGLQEGSRYYISVVSFVPDGYPAIYSVEGSEIPLVVPRQPTGINAAAELNQIQLNWDDNPEADISGYRIYRQVDSGQWLLYQDNVQEPPFTDTQVNGHTWYHYRVTAVDMDSNESDSSEIVSAVPATFDGGILVVDETSQATSVPPQDEQVAFFDMVFGETTYALEQVEEPSSVLSKNIAGQYSSLLWFDDDFATKAIRNSNDNLAWYAGYNGNMMVSGLKTIQSWGSSFFGAGDIRYDEFGLEDYTDNSSFEFAGAHGQYGWPSVEVDTNNILGYLPNVATLQPRPGAIVIYTYNSISDTPELENKPVGLLYQTPHGYRVLLAFPVMFLTDNSAQQLIQYLISQFGETGWVSSYGDIDNSGIVNVADLTILLGNLFTGEELPGQPNNADVDGSCDINIADLTYLFQFLFADGPEPVAGCLH